MLNDQKTQVRGLKIVVRLWESNSKGDSTLLLLVVGLHLGRQQDIQKYGTVALGRPLPYLKPLEGHPPSTSVAYGSKT